MRLAHNRPAGFGPPGVATGESDVRLSLHRKAGCRPNQAISAAAVGMQPIARPLMETLCVNSKA